MAGDVPAPSEYAGCWAMRVGLAAVARPGSLIVTVLALVAFTPAAGVG